MESNDNSKVELPLGWSVLPLSQCTFDGNISYGVVQPGTHAVDGIPILRVNNFRDGCFELQDVLHIAPEIEQKYLRTRLSGGEVLLTLVGSTGQSLVVPSNLAGWNVARAIAVIKPQADISADWINLCLQTGAVQHFLDSRANTTVQKTLNLKDVKEIPIVFPPEDQRRVIEQIATGLNSKIELNRQMNQTLEAMAQAIFQSWFVDFETVKAKQKAKAAGKSAADIEMAAIVALSGKSEEAIGELAAEVRSNLAEMVGLFSDDFVESELGMIPQGWEIGTIDQITQIKGGYAYKSTCFQDEGYPVVKIKNIVGNGTVDLSDCQCISEEMAIKTERFSLSDGDLLMAMTGATVGKIGMVVSANATSYLNQRVAKFEAENLKGNIAWFLFCFFSRNENFERIVGSAQGSAQPNISTGGIGAVQSVLPTKQMLEYFLASVNPLFRVWISNIRQSQTLAELRDSLLPKLLSGELTLPAAQTQVTEALVP